MSNPKGRQAKQTKSPVNVNAAHQDDLVSDWEAITPKQHPAPPKPAPVTPAALGWARDAHEHFFPSRRGMWPIRDWDHIVVYDNNPTPHRHAEQARLRAWLTEQGMPILAEASYPASGKYAGYTTAWIVQAKHAQANEITLGWSKIAVETHR